MNDKKENKSTLLMIGFVCVFIALLCQVLCGEKKEVDPNPWPDADSWIDTGRSLCDTGIGDVNQGEIDDANWHEAHYGDTDRDK